MCNKQLVASYKHLLERRDCGPIKSISRTPGLKRKEVCIPLALEGNGRVGESEPFKMSGWCLIRSSALVKELG